MGHGTIDYARLKGIGAVYTLQDLGELAVRLGSPVSLDRRGNVYWIHSFELGLGSLHTMSTGANADVGVYPYSATGDGMCGGLTPGDAVGNIAGVYNYLPILIAGGWGVEIRFTVPTKLGAFYLRMRHWGSHGCYNYRARYDHSTGNIDIQDSDANWQIIGSPGVQPAGMEIFNLFKLVVDGENQKYERIIFNNHTYLAREYSPLTVPNGEIDLLGIEMYAERGATGAMLCYIDNIIFTQNEPL